MLRKIALLALLALLITPVTGHALGLGEIRVTSALNQPLEAEIALTAVRAGELDSLQIRLAAPESFARVGLDRPFILTQLRFEVGENAQRQPVIKVSTNEPVREPFLNFLVEASWARGRLLREFTVLLDPPVLMPATVTPVRVPEAARQQPLAERTSQPYTAPRSTMPTERWSQASGTYGPVQRAETLWSIAERVRPDGVSNSQMMLAILDANPDAFEGNINFLKAGYVLRIPDRTEVGRRSAAEAMAEVSRQNQAWRSGEVGDFRVSQSGPTAADSRLRLLTPETTGTGTDPAGQVGATGDSELRRQLETARQQLEDERVARENLAERLVELEGEAADLRRRLEIRDSELAAIGDRPVVEAEEPAAPRERPTPTPTPVVEPEDDGVMGMIANPLVLAVLLGVPVIGAIVFFALRRRREASAAHDAMAPLEEPEADDDATQMGDDEATQFAVSTQEEQEPEQYDEPAAMPEPEPEPETEPEAPADDDPMTASAIMELDEGDPTSEADFHLAYGLYDQAAELMEGAIKQHPDRVPYLVKLLEIYFAWGKADEFVKHARDGKDKLEAAGEWGNVAILGRQMAADEELFSASSSTMGATRSDLDLDFAGGGDGDSGGEAEVMDGGTGMFDATTPEDDFTSAFDAPVEEEAATEPEAEAAPASGDDGMEFDLGDFELPETDGGEEATPTTDKGTEILDLDALEEIEDAPTGKHAGPTEDTEVVDLDAMVLDMEDGGSDDVGEKTTFTQDEGSFDDATMEIDLDTALASLGEDSDDDEKTTFDVSGDLDSESGDSVDELGDLSLDFDGMLDDDSASSGAEEEASTGSDSRLDLARAYIDMGDADGARSLLQEVMEEGDENQKKEAKELLDLL